MDCGEADVGFLLAIAEGEAVQAALEGTAVGAREEGFIEVGKADLLGDVLRGAIGALVRRFTGALVGARVFEGEAVGDERDGLRVGALVGDVLRGAIGALVRRFTGALVGARVFEGEAVGDELDGLRVGALVGFTEVTIGVFEGVATGTPLGAATGPLVLVLGALVADTSTCANLREDCKK
jgi:hypothetical protein